MTAIDTERRIGVVGAGTMGAGIAQLAAAAGHPVLLHDARDGAAEAGRDGIAKGLERLVARGKMTQDEVAALIGRIEIARSLADFSDVALAVEAIVEDLGVKRTLFAELEAATAPETILATNTSSISVTAIGRDLRRPGKLVGMHFFNPAPVMKLCEVISGVSTDADAAATVFDTAEAWGKVAVHARSTPGFIVNRVARAFYAEPLRLYEEGVADPATLDALMTEGGGFRMGPFALMDLIGHDVNHAVSLSVYDAYHQEPRFRPSLVQRDLVDAGRLGRKSGRGFYDYAEGAGMPAPAAFEAGNADPIDGLTFAGWEETGGVAIGPTDGRRARDVAREIGRPVILHDLGAEARRVGIAASPDVGEDVVRRLAATLALRDVAVTRLPDWPGLVVMRTVALLANEGFEVVLQGVASEEDIDTAMRYGVNYPQGPMAWARRLGLARVLSILDTLHGLTGDPRYRASLALRMAVRDAEPPENGEPE